MNVPQPSLTRQNRRKFLKFAIWTVVLDGMLIASKTVAKIDKLTWPVTALFAVAIAGFLFWKHGCWAIVTDRQYYGTIAELEVRKERVAVNPRSYNSAMLNQIWIDCAIDTDGGGRINRSLLLYSTTDEEDRRNQNTKVINYRQGDRVFHQRGSRTICRFSREPREGEPNYSLICPTCGGFDPENPPECPFCRNPMPADRKK